MHICLALNVQHFVLDTFIPKITRRNLIKSDEYIFVEYVLIHSNRREM